MSFMSLYAHQAATRRSTRYRQATGYDIYKHLDSTTAKIPVAAFTIDFQWAFR